MLEITVPDVLYDMFIGMYMMMMQQLDVKQLDLTQTCRQTSPRRWQALVIVRLAGT